jgi:hypothetical protein
MAAIASINANVLGSFAAPVSTLTSSDTITYSASRKQLLVVRNGTGSSVTLKIDGDGGTTINAPGAPGISVSAGYDIVIANGASAAVMLNTISAYTQGVVTLTGAADCTAQLFNL